MTGNRINKSSDQPRLTNVASDSDNLQKHHAKARMIDAARKNQSLQQGETSESLNYTVFKGDFTKDSQIIKELADRVNDHINQMAAHIKQQHADIECLDKKLQRKLERKPLSQNLRNDFPKGLDPNRPMIDLIEQAKKDIDFLDRAIKQSQVAEKSQRLEIKLKKTREYNKALELQKYFLEYQMKQLIQEYEKLKRDNQEHIELKEILKKAKPELSPEVKKAYDKLQDLHSRAKHGYEVSNDEHNKVFEKLLGYLSPETLREYKGRGIEFVTDPNAEVFWLVTEKNAKDKCQIKLPLPYKYGIHGMMLRTIDQLLETEHQQDGAIPSPERRAEIAARVFQANFMLGQGKLGIYGFPIEGYELAEKYHKDYKEGIRQAYKDRLISTNTQKEKIREIGHAYARAKYLESTKPPQDIPRVFPSLQPGAYVEERRLWELNEGQQPVKVGSQDFDTLMRNLDKRKQKGENFSLTVTILANKEIWVQPYYIMEGLRSRHPMTAFGNHCVWAGEADIDYETKRVLRIKDQSGHYKTSEKDNPDRMIRFALNEFERQGYKTTLSTMIELVATEGPKELEYKNYKPHTREDLKDSGGLTQSEQYIEDFRQTQQDS
jgi:predicted nuclease with TOPRIM domain